MKAWPFFTAFLILLGALGFIHSLSHGEPIPVKKLFSDFPLRIEDRWEGKELGLDEEVLEKLKVNDYMMRVYWLTSSVEGEKENSWPGSLSLYVGYYQSQRTGATYHSPKNCLPGAGWHFADSSIVPILLNEGQEIRINKVLIQKGLARQMVLYWYQDRGRVIASEYWAKGYMIWDAMTTNRTDGALVRITLPVTKDAQHAFQIGVKFLKDVWPYLVEHMPVPVVDSRRV
ncbi:MAG: EpsI family protein [Nitrospirae bacterium]|nr:EpsI family protein [Nitrospirota bacterium]